MTLLQKTKYSLLNSYIHYINRPALSITLIASFAVIFLIISILYQLRHNLYETWIDNFLGGDSIVTSNNTAYDYFAPLKKESYINQKTFYADYPSLKKTTSPRIKASGFFVNGEREEGAAIIGIDFNHEITLNKHIKLTSGRIPLFSNEGKNELMMSEQLARNLNLTLNDQVIIGIETTEGYQNYDFLVLVGLLDTGRISLLYNDTVAYLPISTMRELIMANKNTANEIIVFRGDFEQGHDERYLYYKALDKLSLSKMADIIFVVLGIILTLFSFCFIAQVILSSAIDIINQRKNEVSVLLTFGALRTDIVTYYIIEITTFTFFVALSGGLFGILLVKVLNQIHLYAFNLPVEFILSSIELQVKVNPIVFLTLFLLFLLLYGLCFILPLYSTLKKKNVMSINMYKEANKVV